METVESWRKSSYSGNGGADCVEVGQRAGRVLVRDTRDRAGALLAVGADAWRRFAATVRESGRALQPAPTAPRHPPGWRGVHGFPPPGILVIITGGGDHEPGIGGSGFPRRF